MNPEPAAKVDEELAPPPARDPFVAVGDFVRTSYGTGSYECLRLYHPDVFREEFPGREPRLAPRYWDDMPAHERRDSYWGIRVRLGKEEYILGPHSTGRTFTTKDPAEKPAPEAKPKKKGKVSA
jgi:hypothetical protein